MQRIDTHERPNWRGLAEELGFIFHTMYGEPYWDESKYYAFSLRQIEDDLEDPSEDLHAMCLVAVDYALQHEEWMARLQIPEAYWDWIAASWKRADPSLYGRFDLLYNGKGPAKLLEYNADTPTSLYESAFFQWVWLEHKLAEGGLPRSVDQYNSLQDKLIDRLGELFEPGCTLHFACCKDTVEDRQTVRYLEDCAAQAQLQPKFTFVEEIGVDEAGCYADDQSILIDSLFKLYPWEDMLREEFACNLPKSNTLFLEPPWKAILSNKGLMPLLWHLFPGHPNLLPAYFEEEREKPDLSENYVRKPLFSREGANVEVFAAQGKVQAVEGDYGEEGFILQAYSEPPRFGDDYVVIGSWVVGNQPAGIGIREDRSRITRDLSRFVPHVIV